LVILMVVDQMRGDFLEHYGPALTGGLRRLMDRGYTFERATHNHARTSTGPGHTTLATGVHTLRPFPTLVWFPKWRLPFRLSSI